MRHVVSVASVFFLAACAEGKPNPESPNLESRTITTGSNIPRKNTGAVVVDRSVFQDQIDRQSVGGMQR